MIIVGLTGSIGMAKSATAQMFRDLGTPVHDADAAVHEMYGPGGIAVGPIAEAFPGVATNKTGVDRNKLRDIVLDDPTALARLEGIVHPLVKAVEAEFVESCKRAGHPVMILDIPLLFEKGGADRMDYVVVVSAPADVQRQRVLARLGMTEEVFESILAKQTPDSIKREKADFVIDTSRGFDHARSEVARILEILKDKAPDKSDGTP